MSALNEGLDYLQGLDCLRELDYLQGLDYLQEIYSLLVVIADRDCWIKYGAERAQACFQDVSNSWLLFVPSVYVDKSTQNPPLNLIPLRLVVACNSKQRLASHLRSSRGKPFSESLMWHNTAGDCGFKSAGYCENNAETREQSPDYCKNCCRKHYEKSAVS